MRYLRAEDILQIHSFVLDETGGAHGLRDGNAVLSTIEQPQQKAFGEELYPDMYVKAAVYAHRIIFGHRFVDGNKRTAMTAAIVFLEDNGCRFRAEQGEIEHYALHIIEERLDVEEIAAWLREHASISK